MASGLLCCSTLASGVEASKVYSRGVRSRVRAFRQLVTSVIKKPESSLPTWVPPTEHRSWCSDPTVQPRREGRARVRDGRRSRCLSSEEATRLWCCVAASPGYRSPGRRGAVEPSTWKRRPWRRIRGVTGNRRGTSRMQGKTDVGRARSVSDTGSVRGGPVMQCKR